MAEQAADGAQPADQQPKPCSSAPAAAPQQSSNPSPAAQAGDNTAQTKTADGASSAGQGPGFKTPGAAAAGSTRAEGNAAGDAALPSVARAMNATKHKGCMPWPPPGLQEPLQPGPVHFKAPGAPLLRPMAKSAMPKSVQPPWPKAGNCAAGGAPSAFGRTARADGGSAPQISNRELIRGPLQNIPNFRLNEMKRHLRDLLAEEDAVVPAPIFSIYCPPEEQSEEQSQDAARRPAGEAGRGDAGRDGDATASSATVNDGSSSNNGTSGDTAHGATWDCPSCGETNKSTRNQCNNCSKARPGSEAGKSSSATGSATDDPRGVKRKRQSMLISSAWREGARAAAELSLKRKLEHAKEGDKLELYLRQINYTQDSIKMQFRDGRPVATMRHELVKGEKKLEEIPTISALVHEGRVYTVDNRRLWAFKNCGLPENTRIPVLATRADHSFRLKFTTPTGGRTVRRRADDGFAMPVKPAPVTVPPPPGKNPAHESPAPANPPGLSQAHANPATVDPHVCKPARVDPVPDNP